MTLFSWSVHLWKKWDNTGKKILFHYETNKKQVLLLLRYANSPHASCILLVTQSKLHSIHKSFIWLIAVQLRTVIKAKSETLATAVVGFCDGMHSIFVFSSVLLFILRISLQTANYRVEALHISCYEYFYWGNFLYLLLQWTLHNVIGWHYQFM